MFSDPQLVSLTALSVQCVVAALLIEAGIGKIAQPAPISGDI